MRNWVSMFAFIIFLSFNTSAFAAWQLNFQLSRENDGSFSGEMWYNNDMLWRLTFQTDGALPASSGYDPRVTVVAPDIVNGLFVLRVHR